jgi:peptidoglycan/LPS O-acetylase OafA/YrhL
VDQTAPTRLDSLTGLRFIAAALVVVIHASYLLEHDAIAEAMQRGGVGVGFFFILSGFVLTWTARPSDRLRSFYRRRFARVYPSHLLTWAIMLLLLPFVFDRTQSMFATLATLLLVQAWVPDDAVYFGSNGVAWSLSCEAFFYAVFPFMLPRLRPLRRRALLVCGIGCVGLVTLLTSFADLDSERWRWALFVFPPTRCLEFVMGVVLALAMRSGWRPTIGLRSGLAIAVGAFAVSIAAPARWIVPVMVVPLALLIATAASSDIEGRPSLFARPWFVKLGEWSFALYLVHTFGYQAAEHALGERRLGLLEGGALGVGLAIAALVAAALLHELWEKPWERRLRGAPGLASEPGAA